jgi:hypothetical protein
MTPLLSTRPRAIQAALAVGGPVAFGVLCGVLLASSETAYLLVSILSILGGFFAGFEHPGPREGAIRGVLGGTLFGAFILIAHEVDGREAAADLPDPAILLVLVTLLFGALLGALGGYARRRAERTGAS